MAKASSNLVAELFEEIYEKGREFQKEVQQCAKEARAGIKVPCAMVGAELPTAEEGKPFKIKIGKLRGVESQGMLCSARELQLSEDHGGLLELPSAAPIGASVREYMQLDDNLFTLKLTPNLAHCLSVYGIARELSALTGAPLITPAIESVPASGSDHRRIVGAHRSTGQETVDARCRAHRQESFAQQ